jgi:hypothetical protein
MDTYDLFLKELSDFKETYSKNLSERITTIKIDYLRALKTLGLESTADGAFIEIEDTLRKAENLSDLDTKIKTIKTLGSRVQRDMFQLCNATQLDEDQSRIITEFQLDFNDFAYSFLKSVQDKIMDEARKRLLNITDCPYAQEENRTRNALDFQQNVIEFLGWIFFDEIRLLSKKEIKEDKLKRDGIFKVLESFDFQRRGVERIEFGHILVECKNYKKPSYDDLMQVHAYTLLNKIFPIVYQPLCLLVSRENPSRNSITYKMRDKLFEKKEKNDFLLVLFLACDDLQKMYDQKLSGGDPFEVLTAQIRRMLDDNVTCET